MSPTVLVGNLRHFCDSPCFITHMVPSALQNTERYWKILKNIECFTTTLWFITPLCLENTENYLRMLKNTEKYWEKILKKIECFPTSLWFITRMVPICLATSFVISILATWNRITSVRKCTLLHCLESIGNLQMKKLNFITETGHLVRASSLYQGWNCSSPFHYDLPRCISPGEKKQYVVHRQNIQR